MLSLFLFTNVYVYVLALAMLLLMIELSHVPFKFIIRGMKAIVVLLIITAVFNLFLTKGTTFVSFWKFTITEEGLRNAGFMSLRLIFLILGSSIMTLTTSPNQLTDGLERVFGFLKIFKVPVHELAMMMSIALRFIPILVDETDKIMKAQLARCADFESKNIFKKAKSFIPVLVPLFVSAFRRAGDLAMAMEARCYQGGQGRTKMKPLKYKGRDILTYLVFVLYLAGIFVCGILLPKLLPIY